MMKIGIIPINVGVHSVEQMVGLAQAAEAAGLDSVWTFEHVIVPMDYQSAYPYSEDGKMGVEPDTNFVDPLIALTTVAAHTKTLKLATGVNILPQANPLYMAKQAASLDMLSGGRFSLGVGIGWLREEFQALGVPFEKRGARFDDYMEAMQKVWSGDVVEHDSEFISWHGFKSYPIPGNKKVPVVIGGDKGKAYKRIAKYADGWFAPVADPAQLAAPLAAIRAEFAAIGRNFSDLEISCMWLGMGGKEAISAYAKAGVHRLIVPLPALGDDTLAGIRRIGECAQAGG